MARYQGRLIEWHDDKGYGFIQGISDAKHQRVFLHVKSFQHSGPRPIQGCVVEYEVGLDDRSRPQAINVSYVKAKQVQNSATMSQQYSNTQKKLSWHPMYIFMICYWVLSFVISAYGKLPPFTLMVIMLINAYTYWAYYKDKQAAMNNEFRISEQHLLLMSALGGWTASWFAQRNFRHKTQKSSFKNAFYFSILINIGLIIFSIWFYSIY